MNMSNIAQLIGETVGNYKLLDVLGEGGMGAVYKAEHILIGKKVALKMLHAEYSEKPEIVQRFFTEAKAVNRIGHRNIVDISDYGQSDEGRPYFIMELLEGIELAKEIEKKGAMDTRRVLNILKQAVSALEASHKHGIVHRDLKPENIFLISMGDSQDFVKVLDFGIAKLQEGDKGHSKTKTGLIMGTPAYMAPEQAEGLNVDHRSDIYSLGIIFYEMLTGEQPFAADTFSRVLIKVLTEPVPAPRIKNPNIPHAIEAVLLKMVEKDPAARFQTASEIIPALRDAENNIMPAGAVVPVQVGKTSLRSPNPTTLSGINGEVAVPANGPSRMSLILGGAAVLLLSAGAVVFFMVGPGQSWLSSTPDPIVATPTVVAPTSVVVEITKEEIPATVTVELSSKPDGATVRKDGTEIGQTPMKFDLPLSETAIVYEISKEGFAVEVVEITPNTSSKNAVTLNKNTKKVKPEATGKIVEADPKATKPDPTDTKAPPKPDDTIGKEVTIKPDFRRPK
jgi:eukaryotic-like serine/threonine-protein kinase